MEIVNILKSILVLSGLSLILGITLTIVFRKLTLKISGKEEPNQSLWSGVNSGGCKGFEANDHILVDIGTEDSPEKTKKIDEVLGMGIEEMQLKVCVLRCKGGQNEALKKYDYHGPIDCRISSILFKGNKLCEYGCLGGGHCVTVCPFHAIKMGSNYLPFIDPNKCTACGICVRECPRQVLELIPRSQLIYLACSILDEGEDVKDFCRVGCTGCSLCISACPYEKAIAMQGSLPSMNYQMCASCGICYNKCPTNSFIDRAKARPYAIIATQCDGCGECIEVCQFNAIEGESGKKHTVIKDKCIGCGRCFEICPMRVITIAGALGYADEGQLVNEVSVR